MKFRLFLHFIQLVVNLVDILQIDKESELSKVQMKTISRTSHHSNFWNMLSLVKLHDLQCSELFCKVDFVLLRKKKRERSDSNSSCVIAV